MQHQFIAHGAGWGALVGWLSAVLVIVLTILDAAYRPGLLGGLSMVVIYPLFVGTPVGALAGAACGMGAAMAVGSCTDPRSAMPRAALGAIALPMVVAATTRAPMLLIPAAVGMVLLLLSTPRVLKTTTLRTHAD